MQMTVQFEIFKNQLRSPAAITVIPLTTFRLTELCCKHCVSKTVSCFWFVTLHRCYMQLSQHTTIVYMVGLQQLSQIESVTVNQYRRFNSWFYSNSNRNARSHLHTNDRIKGHILQSSQVTLSSSHW